MKRIQRMFAAIGTFVADLFKGPGNAYWDLGRILGFLAPTSLILTAIWNMHLGKDIDLGPGGFAGGMSAVLTAVALFILAKDRSSKAVLDAS